MVSRRFVRLVGAPVVGLVLAGVSFVVPSRVEGVSATEPPPVEVAAGGEAVVPAGSDLEGGRRDEVASKRTEFSRTFETVWPGVFQAEIYTRPVFARDQKGGLVPVDTSLKPTPGGGFHSAVSDRAVSVPSRLGEGARLRVENPEGQWVQWAPISSVGAEARVDGSEASFSELWAGVDLSVRDTGTGAKATYTLASPAAATDLYFTVTTSGLQGALDGDGNVILRDQAGDEVFVIPHGWMLDSRSTMLNPQGFSDGVTYSWEPGPDQTATLGVHLDKAWLASPDRVFPVKVDPSVLDAATTGDTFVWGGWGGSSNFGSDPQLFTGLLPWFGGYTRTLLKFDNVTPNPIPAGGRVIDAQLGLSNFQYQDCKTTDVNVYAIVGPWDPATVTWANKPPIGATPISGAHAPVGDPRERDLPDPGCKGKIRWTVTDWVRHWVDNTAPNYGFELVASPESAWLNLYRSTESAVPADKYPRLVVLYSAATTALDPVPAGAPTIQAPPLTLTSPTTPNQFTATYNDATGKDGKVFFFLYDANTEKLLMAKATGVVNPGQQATYTLTNEDKAFLQCRMDLSHSFRLEATAAHDIPSPNDAEAVFGPTITRVFSYNVGGRPPLVCLDFPDPAIVLDGQTFHVFGTNLAQGDANYGWDQHYNVPVVSTQDGVNLQNTYLPKEALPSANVGSWVLKNAGTPEEIWAPDVHNFGGTFVLYYTAKHTNGKHCIGVATSTTPQGPYQGAAASPLLCTGDTGCSDGCIDASVAFQNEGDAGQTPYLLWRSDATDTTCGGWACLFSRQLTIDGQSFASPTTTKLLGPIGPDNSSWTYDDPQAANTIEQPEAVYSPNGQLVLFYSGGSFTDSSYGVGHATCDSFTQECDDETDDRPWFGSEDNDPPPTFSNLYAKGPGAVSLIQANCGGEMLFAHHGWTNGETTWPLGARATFFSGLGWNNNTPEITTVPSIYWNCG